MPLHFPNGEEAGVVDAAVFLNGLDWTCADLCVGEPSASSASGDFAKCRLSETALPQWRLAKHHCPNMGFGPNPLLELNAEASSFSLVPVFASLADKVLIAAPNGDDELRPTNAPKPPAGLFTFAAAGANAEDVV